MLLPRITSSAPALDLLWSSRRIGAEEALRIGLVERVVPPEELFDTCHGYVEQLADTVSPAALADQIARLLPPRHDDGRRQSDEALAIGLVSEVFPAESFRDDVDAVVARLLEKSPTALRAMKEHDTVAERMGRADFVALESERHLRIAASEHTAEAFRAFVEKRKPEFG